MQGDFSAHLKIFSELGVKTRLVRTPRDLEEIDGIAIPGGESTVMSRLSERYGLFEPLRTRIAEGLPAFGTCAGLIFLAKHIDGASQTFQQTTLGVLDCTVARNAYGAQRESFQTRLEVAALGDSIPATFIRAPKITAIGENVEVLATWQEAPVVVRQSGIMACSFHPEIEGESRLHQLWLHGALGLER
ncbi:pyridoxal 5'-phosphate synthase subunit PdxT [Abditibacteriota bacterium]|nr:pyridoxal 5'-phosphate synthase subunit PdxT [Abditibacteriota bacterium]